VSIRRHVLETAKRRLVEAQADLDALLEEPPSDTEWAPGEAVGHVGTRTHEALRKQLSRAGHYGLQLSHVQVDYIARVVLETEVIVDDTVFDIGALPAYAERLVERAHEDSTKLKEQSEQLRALKGGPCPVCEGSGWVNVKTHHTNGDVSVDRKACTVSTCAPGREARAFEAATRL